MRRVLLIGYRLEPSNVLAVQRFLDRQMPRQCFSPGAIHIVSPGRISLADSPSS